MPRKRNPENRGLPARWQRTHGAYYYLVPSGLESMWDDKRRFRLGKTLPDAYKEWARRIGSHGEARTVADVLDRYLLEVVPTKAAATREGNALQIRQLRAVFGAMPIASIKPRHVYLYVDKRAVKKRDENGRVTGGRIAAHREVEILSHALTKAVEWGLIDRHPFKGEVRLTGEPPRARDVQEWELVEALALKPRQKKGGVLALQAYLRLKMLTGMSQGDLLRLTAANITPDGIRVTRHKTAATTGKTTLYEWTPDLRAAHQQAIDARPALSPFVFCTRRGAGYVNEAKGRAQGFKSMWQRFMARLLAETKVTEAFTEHDIRAYVAGTADSLERARALLSHADSRTTQRAYRRKAEVVRPLKGIG